MKQAEQAALRASRRGYARTDIGDDEVYWPTDVAPWRLALDRTLLETIERGCRWALQHWLLIANLSNAATVAGAAATPFLMAMGWANVGGAVFAVYSLICEQNPAHSYFLFGHQMAIDQRMLAIYVSATLAGLLYAPIHRRLPVLPLRWYLVLTAPMAIDGFTQFFGWRHSNWELRSATGALFGMATVWWLYSFLDRGIARIRRGLERQHDSKRDSTAGVGPFLGGQA